ncbi:DUF3601 domain-containing protein [Terrimonas sp. NA20]|uniref:DUF3601 domain-containing protein n=1 Tax=Terrimonas ginsenosidimutans TaxID=2908004 RepID=A0ABS9KMC0_9BACT|nr:DUF3601 domain-containing protein [Terrimonas ginsenosidimutans]MCG2613463.1 DUF3601 domain-containing protein [Terrimonas ginsenosidimutans]
MSNPLKLIPGQKYRIVKSFTDYDNHVHPPGEAWTFLYTNFLPYEDGLTVHLHLYDDPREVVLFRLQWRAEAQAAIIEHFNDYVVPVND